jgi:Family of unknown function (DUF6941)
VDSGIEVDFLIVADRAEVINGKLYTMGAAWDRIGVADFSKPMPLSVAVGVLVPWTATNQPHAVTLTLRDADGGPLDFRVEANFVTGRPPFLNGEVQRVLFAIPGASVLLPGPGNYVLAAAIDGAEMKVVRFGATAAQSPPAGPPP